MKILSTDKEIDKGKLTVEFTDGELVMIAKAHGDMFGKPVDPARMTQKQISRVINKMITEEIKKEKERLDG